MDTREEYTTRGEWCVFTSRFSFGKFKTHEKFKAVSSEDWASDKKTSLLGT